LGTKQLLPGERAVGQLRFESPMYAFAGDRFILRDWPEQHTLAGGIVLDPDAPRRDFRAEPRQAALESCATSPNGPDAFVMAKLLHEGSVPRDSVLLKSRFATPEVAQAVARLAAAGKAVMIDQTVADLAWWSDRRRRALEAIAAAHKAHPEDPGLRMTDLRNAVGNGRDIGDVFDALVADLCRQECARAGTAIRLASHRPALPPKLQAAGARLRAALAAGKLDPPSRSQLAPDPLTQQALRFLIQNGEAVDVAEELVLSAEAYDAAIGAIRQILRQRTAATVSEIRQAMNSSRRIMVPLLEKLDRDGITVRKGDQRLLKQSN
jgi:selenocysteine-specific elongation factor